MRSEPHVLAQGGISFFKGSAYRDVQFSISRTSHRGRWCAVLFAAKGEADVIERLLIKTREIHLNQTRTVVPRGAELATRHFEEQPSRGVKCFVAFTVVGPLQCYLYL